MARVTLDNVSKRFGDVSAVKNLSLDIQDKEFLALVGPSGCGKTTTLRMVAGLERPTAGDVLIGGRVVNAISPQERDVAMVFQNYALYPHMTVSENMAFGLTHHRVARAEIDAQIQKTAALLGIETLLSRRPRELSGGQRQRVALGRAIVRAPQAFLMDEPLSNLDAQLRIQTRAELTKLHRRLGITTLYVTHDQAEAMTMSDRLAVLRDGVLQQCDTPMTVYAHPANLFVAGFIGTPSMNFVLSTLRRDSDGYLIDAGSFCIPTPPAQAGKLDACLGKRVILGIRPADIYDTGRRTPVDATPTNTIRTKVDFTEPMGNTTTLYLTAGAHPLVAIVDAEIQVKPGDTLDMAFDMAKAHLFDMETEQAIY